MPARGGNHKQFLGLRALKPKLVVRDLSPALWPALEQLFGARGACGGCWCMYWRLEKGERWDDLKGAPAKRRMKALVTAGKARGAIAFAGKEPVGWIAYRAAAGFSAARSGADARLRGCGAGLVAPLLLHQGGLAGPGRRGRSSRACAQVAAPAGRENRGGLPGEPQAGAAAAECLRLDGHALALSGCGLRARGSGDDLKSADAAQALRGRRPFSSTRLPRPPRSVPRRAAHRGAALQSAARAPAGRSGRG